MNQPGPAIDPEIALLARLIIQADPSTLRRAAKSLAFKTQRFSGDDPRALWRGLDTVARAEEGSLDPALARWTSAPSSARPRSAERALTGEAQTRRRHAHLDLERLANDRRESPHRYVLDLPTRRAPRRHHHANQ